MTYAHAILIGCIAIAAAIAVQRESVHAQTAARYLLASPTQGNFVWQADAISGSIRTCLWPSTQVRDKPVCTPWN